MWWWESLTDRNKKLKILILSLMANENSYLLMFWYSNLQCFKNMLKIVYCRILFWIRFVETEKIQWIKVSSKVFRTYASKSLFEIIDKSVS